jgi:hypothetical protein
MACPYVPPALNAVDFDLVLYTPPTLNAVNFELCPATAPVPTQFYPHYATQLRQWAMWDVVPSGSFPGSQRDP